MPIKGPAGRLLPLPRNLRVCTMSADFWGLPTAGGTATAYGLLTSALSEDPSLDVRVSASPASSWIGNPSPHLSTHPGPPGHLYLISCDLNTPTVATL